MSLRGALANVRGRHKVRHIPGSGDQAVTVIARETAETLADHDPPVLTTTVGQRVVFADAAQTGRLAFEIDETSPAAREIAALAAEIDRLRIGRIAA